MPDTPLQRRTSRNVQRLCWRLFVFVWLTSLFASAKDAVTFWEEWQEKMNVVRREIENRFNSPEPHACGCAYHACEREPKDGVVCLQANTTDKVDCGTDHCGHMKINTAHSYHRTPPDASIGSYHDSLKRDFCLTEGLESAFEGLRDYGGTGFTPWSYLGVSGTGLMVSWPGKPREQGEDSLCLPYDPRERPWWSHAAWLTRNLVIVLDMSATMMDNVPHKAPIRKWSLSIRLAIKLLRTLTTDDDMFQIVLMRGASEVLHGSTSMMDASEENIKKTIERLDRLEPDWVGETQNSPGAVDIGAALELSFGLLHNSSINHECEKHIVLFTESEDCTASTDNPCAAKIYANHPGGEYLLSGVSKTLEFAESLQNRFRKGPTNTTLFVFSLDPQAVGLTSQLACRLGGVHVDLELELRDGILDPAALLRSYFRRAAFSVYSAFREANQADPQTMSMAVSPIYDDDGGLGKMNTLVMPVFFKPKERCPALHYGVLGADITLDLYHADFVETRTEAFGLAVNNWNSEKRLLQCSPEPISPCHMQALRGREAQCVYRLDSRGGKPCYSFKNYTYSVDYEQPLRLETAKLNCLEAGGELIAPRDPEEKRFLATLVPPDGAWINLTKVDNEWRWPSGEAMTDEENRNIRRTCKEFWATEGIYMDPRNFNDNFQCVQGLTLRTRICRFPADNVPSDACQQVCQCDLRECELGICLQDWLAVDEGDFVSTIETCRMEDCLLENISTRELDEVKAGGIPCNSRGNGEYNYTSLLCCDIEDLEQVCSANQTVVVPRNDSNEENSMDTGLIFVFASVGLALMVSLLICLACLCRSRFGKKQPKLPVGFSLSDSFRRNRLELVGQNGLATAGSVLSNPQKSPCLKRTPLILGPFESSPSGQQSVGKRPELVVNIEVKVLDNGWEKVGGYGRVRQGEYTDGIGEVHKVAVKFVDALAPSAAWEALKNEFDILASIPLHPNIVKPIGAHWGDRSRQTTGYIVEELMHTNLGDLMRGTEPHPYPDKQMTYQDWIRIFIDITRGLEHLHQYKIIHFDLKPRNVLLDESLRAKIADFGCSKSKFDTYIELSKMAGTPPYLAPECWMLYYAQNSRAEVARAKIDIYSLGVIMWECLNGGASLSSALYKQSTAVSPTSPSPNHRDNIEIIRESRSSGQAATQELSSRFCIDIEADGNPNWEIQYHLREEIPTSLRNLVNHCVRVDFDSRPSCDQILAALQSMLQEDWIQRPLP